MSCLLCGLCSVERSLFGGFRYRGRTYYRMRCAGCGFIFVDPTPDRETFEAMYGDDYFSEYYGGGHDLGYEQGLEAGLRASAAILDRLRPYAPTGHLLDVGCAGGHFLIAARERGYKCLGVELNPKMAERARQVFGLEVLDGSFEKVAAGRLGCGFDVIYMGDTLEHLPDPAGALRRVRELLAPQGVFTLNGPLTLNRSLYTACLKLKLALGKGRSEWYVDEPPYHLWEFNADTMRCFLVGNGFEILEFTTSEEFARPAELLARVLRRPLTFRERTARLLKDGSAWCTNRLLARFGFGDRVLALARAVRP